MSEEEHGRPGKLAFQLRNVFFKSRVTPASSGDDVEMGLLEAEAKARTPRAGSIAPHMKSLAKSPLLASIQLPGEGRTGRRHSSIGLGFGPQVLTTPPLHLERSSLATSFSCPNMRAGQGVCFSPNGRYTLRWSFGPDIKLLQSHDVELLNTMTCGTGNVRITTWSYDSKYLAASTEDCMLYIWDLDQRSRRAEISTGKAVISQCVFSKDGSMVLSCDDDGGVRLWDVPQAKLLRQYEIGHGISHVQFADDGHAVVLGNADEAGLMVLKLDDNYAEIGREEDMMEEIVEHRTKVTYRFSADGEWMLTYILETCASNLVLKSTSTFDGASFHAASGNITHCDFTGDGRTFVVCGRDNIISIYDTATRLQLHNLAGHNVDVMFCKVSSDVKHVVSGDTDGNILCWDMDTATVFCRMKGHSSPIAYCDVTPEGSRALSVDNEGNVLLWNLDTKASSDVLLQQSDTLCCLEYTANSERVAVGYRDGSVKLYDLASRKLIWQYEKHNGPVHVLSLAANGLYLASGGRDGTVIIVHMASGELAFEISHHEEAIVGLTYSADGQILVAAGHDSCVSVWKASDASQLLSLVPGGKAVPTALALSTTGDQIGISTRCGRLVLWLASNGKLVMDIRVSDVAATALCFCSSGDTVAVGTADGSSYVFDIGKRLRLHRLVGNSSPVNNVYFSGPDTKLLVSVCSRQSITWNLFKSNKKASVADFILDRDGTYNNNTLPGRIFVAHHGMSVYDPHLRAAIYDMKEHEKHPGNSYLFRNGSCVVQYGGHPVVIYAPPMDTIHMLAQENAGFRTLDFSSDGILLVSGTLRGELHIWDVPHRQALYSWPAHRRSAITCVKFTHDSSAVYSCAEDCKVILWDWRTRKQIAALDVHKAPVVTVEMSLDGRVMASGDKDGVVIVWDARTKQPIQTKLCHDGPVLCCTISPDGTKVASSGQDERVFIMDASSGQELVNLDDALDGKGLTIKFSFDGTRVQVGSDKGRVLIWDVNLNCLLYDIAAHEGKVYDASWSGDSRRLLSVGSDGHARLWDTAAGSQICEANFERGFGVVESGGFINCDLSVTGSTMAGVTAKGTFVLWDVACELRKAPDGNMVYEWLASMPLAVANDLYKRLLLNNPMLYNLQDSRGWTMLMHAAHNSNPEVIKIILQLAKAGSRCIGLTSSAVANTPAALTEAEAEVLEAYGGSGSHALEPGSSSDSLNMEEPNALRVALNSNSADCVQYLLDAVLEEKITTGSYHAVTSALPEIALQYPGMCEVFLTNLPLLVLGEIEIPADIAAGGTQVVVHSSYTSYKELWQAQLGLEAQTKGPMVVMEAAMVRLPFSATVGAGSMLDTLVGAHVPLHTFGSETVKAIIDYKWKAFGRRQIYTKSAIYFTYTCLYTSFAVIFAAEDFTMDLPTLLTTGAGQANFAISIMLFTFGTYYLGMECFQLVKVGAGAYFESLLNTLDVSAYMATLAVMPCYWGRVGIGDSQPLPVIIALETILLWVKMLFFALAVDGLGTFIIMTIEIIRGIRYFVILLLVMFISFGVAFMVLFRTSDSNGLSIEFGDFGTAMLNIYVVIFSNTDPRLPLDTEWPAVSTILFCIYSFFLVVIMVNMLIALMSDIYDRVKLNQQLIFLQGRAELIIECESTLRSSVSERLSRLPPYLHILAPAKRNVAAAMLEDEAEEPDWNISALVTALLSKMEVKPKELRVTEMESEGPTGLGGPKLTLERSITGLSSGFSGDLRQPTMTSLDIRLHSMMQNVESLMHHYKLVNKPEPAPGARSYASGGVGAMSKAFARQKTFAPGPRDRIQPRMVVMDGLAEERSGPEHVFPNMKRISKVDDVSTHSTSPKQEIRVGREIARDLSFAPDLDKSPSGPKSPPKIISAFSQGPSGRSPPRTDMRITEEPLHMQSLSPPSESTDGLTFHKSTSNRLSDSGREILHARFG